MFKICSKCNKEKDLSEFHKDKTKKDSYYSSCKKCRELIEKPWRDRNKEKISLNSKKYYNKNKNKILKRQQQYYIDNKEYIDKRNKNWSLNNIKKRNNYFKNKRKTDVNYRLLCNFRSRVNSALKKKYKSLGTMFLIGCEIDYLMYHIQKQFKTGMNWDNYGEWHIDHKRPCASFDLSKEEEQRKCFNYTNLQPLWAEDNLKKKDKVR